MEPASSRSLFPFPRHVHRRISKGSPKTTAGEPPAQRRHHPPFFLMLLHVISCCLRPFSQIHFVISCYFWVFSLFFGPAFSSLVSLPSISWICLNLPPFTRSGVGLAWTQPDRRRIGGTGFQPVISSVPSVPFVPSLRISTVGLGWTQPALAFFAQSPEPKARSLFCFYVKDLRMAVRHPPP